jgi:hypothetical protein
MFKNAYFEGITRLQIFETLHVLILEFHFRVPKSFGHFNVAPMASHTIEYKEGNSESSQVWTT